MSVAEDDLAMAQRWCREAEAVIITAGAGMGVDSGLPDFRGNEGFWKAYPPYRHLGFKSVEMASPARFIDAPELGWGFYGHRLQLYQKTKPHVGFAALKAYADSLPMGGFVFTSNVDGHFQVAGFSDEQMVECHGSIRHLQCFHGCTESIWKVGDTDMIIDPKTMRAQAPLPQCPECGGLARPNILMFGDWNWISHRTAAQEARMQQWLQTLQTDRIVILEFGAGTAIPTVRHFSESVASQLGAHLIRVNPREPQVPSPAIGLTMGARKAVEALLPFRSCI